MDDHLVFAKDAADPDKKLGLEWSPGTNSMTVTATDGGEWFIRLTLGPTELRLIKATIGYWEQLEELSK